MMRYRLTERRVRKCRQQVDRRAARRRQLQRAEAIRPAAPKQDMAAWARVLDLGRRDYGLEG